MKINRRVKFGFKPMENIRGFRAAVVLEVVLVIAILIAIAVLFNNEARAFAAEMFSTVFGSSPALSIVG